MQQDLGGFVLPPSGTDDLESRAPQSRRVLGQALQDQQSQLAASQQQEIKSVQEQQDAFEQPKIKPTGTAGWFQNMGQTSPYQVTSHYYGQWPPTKNQKRKSTGR